MLTNVSENIRELRKKTGLTQQMLAKELAVSYQAVSAWERGQSLPDLENTIRLALFFHVSLDCLVGEKTKNEK